MVKIGQTAPAFKALALVEGKEKEITLNDYKGKKIAIYFYPKDLTPGCTTQACNLRDNYSVLKENGIEILGISVDSMKSHEKFAEKKELPFTLVSDENKKIVQDYDVWGDKSMYGRIFKGVSRKTFLINEDLKIVKIIEKPKVGQHATEIIEGFSL